MDYTINLTMQAATVQTLLGQGNVLVAMSAVRGRDLQALPLVWVLMPDYGEITLLQCSTTYAAYTAPRGIVAGKVVHPMAMLDAAPGDVVNAGAGVLTAGGKGSAGAITIANTVKTPFTCGISQSVNGDPPAPVCAYPLNGGSWTQTIVPLPQVVLFFTSTPLTVGEAFSANIPDLALSPIVAVDLTSHPTANVAFDLDRGWSPQAGTIAGPIELQAVVSTLIQPGRAPSKSRFQPRVTFDRSTRL